MINPAMFFKYKQHAWMLLLAILCLFVAASCQHKDLCIHHPHEVTLRVEFDWRNAPKANPEGMCAFFYPHNGGNMLRFDFRGTKGGSVVIPAGKYHVVTYNNDTECVLYKGMEKHDDHTVYTREGHIFEPVYGSSIPNKSVPRAENTEGEKVVINPDMMWGGRAVDVEITESGISYLCISEKDKEKLEPSIKEEHVITLYPKQVVCHYSYEIRNVQNLKYATQMCGSLSSMAGEHTFWDSELGRAKVTVPFEAGFNLQKTKIEGEFYTFGHHLENEAPHMFLLYVWMKDGGKYYYEYNVTNQVHEAEDPLRVHIIIDGLELPKPIENGGGFDVGVDDWDSEEHDVFM